jgi:hypothetical protein
MPHATRGHAVASPYADAQRPPVQLATRGGIVTGPVAAWCAALSAEARRRGIARGPVTPADLDAALSEIRDAAEAVTGKPCPVVPGGPGAPPVRGLPLLDTAAPPSRHDSAEARTTDPARRRLAFTNAAAAWFAEAVEAVLADAASANDRAEAVPGGDSLPPGARVAPHAAPHAPISGDAASPEASAYAPA